jgi:hypothetical protein
VSIVQRRLSLAPRDAGDDVKNRPSLEGRLFTRTMKHPVLAPLIEFVPTHWLLQLANPVPSRTTNLECLDSVVDWGQLFDHLMKFGMRDPFIVGVGRVTRRVRLETGNQRIRVMDMHQVSTVPAVAYVSDAAVTSTINGPHGGEELPLRLPVPEICMDPYPIKVFARLSDVLTQVPTAKE